MKEEKAFTNSVKPVKGLICIKINEERGIASMKLNFINLEEHLMEGVREVCTQVGIFLSEDGMKVTTKCTSEGLFVKRNEEEVQIGYHMKSEFFRALGLLSENSFKEERPLFNTLGCMFDCSRNAVPHVDAVKRMLRIMALMGYNAIMLYTEDTYELKKYPYFGYMRGRYTQEELIEIDRYAGLFGIEVIPCIQTLAHLNAIKRWQAFSEQFDCDDILLIDDEETYKLIEEMIKSMANTFSSKRIHIGMDEAHMAGLGRYLDIHGYQDRFELLLRHQKKVSLICKKYGYSPMIWSDMYFRILSPENEYYDLSVEITDELRSQVPAELNLMYWDYDHQDCEFYEKMIDNHFKLSSSVSFAGGARKWMGPEPQLEYSNVVARPALEACAIKQVKDVYVTAWANGGAECPMFSVLPVLQLFAEKCYANDDSESHIAKRLYVCANASYHDFMQFDLLNLVPGNEHPEKYSHNPSKYLLYQDVLCGLFDKHVDSRYPAHFAKAAQTLGEAAERAGEWAYIFENIANLSSVLSLKCDMGVRLKKAYDCRNTEVIKAIACAELPELRKKVAALHNSMRLAWLKENKPFGMDVLDLRLGGMMTRFDTVILRLNDYLAGNISNIEELDQERLFYDCREESEQNSLATCCNQWEEIATACSM
jgi:hexosaminidase